MTVFIDADGCPVVDIAVEAARKRHTECIILCDTSHVFDKEGAKTITVSKGADSVDFALVNMLQPGDIVVTQDYGLAAMCLARKAIVISQDGLLYTDDNIDSLLQSRYEAKKIRNAGGRMKGPKKRKQEQDMRFLSRFNDLLEK
ncbi:MAG: YaiI/YqxD family protein [Eubacteriales bacterium]|nr:YaiI/YqxD family protein [Eubacteriales bacterium]MDD4475044.1 YaiI/YqxD family protein [Eubacteriales bacterium]